MCFSNDKLYGNITNELITEIRNRTKYKFIETVNETNNITTGKIALEDRNGKRYLIYPNSNGLKFAVGEINYGEYVSLENKESLKVFSIFFGAVGGIISIMFLVSVYFT